MPFVCVQPMLSSWSRRAEDLTVDKIDLERRSKTPVHLDLASSEWLAEIDRLTGLGATVRQRFERHAWMRDLEGNDFCIVAADEAPSRRVSTRSTAAGPRGRARRRTWMLVVFCRIRRGPFVEGLRVRQRVGREGRVIGMTGTSVRGAKPLRFGVVAPITTDLPTWRDQLRGVADSGYSTILMPDVPQWQPAPGPALAVAATITGLRVGTWVYASPVRPAWITAWEAHSLSVLTDGRFEMGIGTGRPGIADQLRELGLPVIPASQRSGQVREVVTALRELDGLGPAHSGGDGRGRPEGASAGR